MAIFSMDFSRPPPEHISVAMKLLCAGGTFGGPSGLMLFH